MIPQLKRILKKWKDYKMSSQTLPLKLGVLAASAFLLLSLTNCAGSGSFDKVDTGAPKQVRSMSAIPTDVKICFIQTVPEPQNIQTKEQIVKVITDLKKSEKAKTRCGQRLIDFYESHKEYL